MAQRLGGSHPPLEVYLIVTGPHHLLELRARPSPEPLEALDICSAAEGAHTVCLLLCSEQPAVLLAEADH